MFCPKCGTPNDDDAFKCVQCGNVLKGPPAGPMEEIPSYLVWAIVCTVLCCIPFGIVAIIYAAQVSSKVAGGDVEGAREASRKAKNWCIAAFATGLGVGILSILLQVVAAAVAASAGV